MADESPKKTKHAAKTHITDPLEAAKMDKPAPVAAVLKVEAPMEVKAAPVEAPKAALLKSYRVVKTTTVSLHGQMVRLNEGDIISAASHGPMAVDRILGSNVALAEVK